MENLSLNKQKVYLEIKYQIQAEVAQRHMKMKYRDMAFERLYSKWVNQIDLEEFCIDES